MQQHTIYDTPPHDQLLRIAIYAPLAVELYLKLWASRDGRNTVSVIANSIPEDWRMSKTKFRNRLHLLCKMEVLDYREIDKSDNIEIQLMIIDSFGDDKIPC